MATSKLLECSFLIPIRRDRYLSDGQLHRRSAWKWLDDRLMTFEGGTRALELYEGWYHDPDTGRRVADRSRRFWMAVAPDRIAQLRALLKEACRVFWQKSIYLSVAGHVEFVRGPSDESG